ncbi:MAG: aminoacyl-tRNA hydrolase [Gammaproteobacteria bacterium]|nr:MAG: aminoacyl-tRNA hydrolase [Gammaproteobacteria bacterium]
MFIISNNLSLSDDEIKLSAIRAQGSGGQNVNKVSSAIHLRFDIMASSLPDKYKQRLKDLADSRISNDGIIIIKAQQHRTQEMNREAALKRLKEIISRVLIEPKVRRPTKPTKGSQNRRLDGKQRRGKIKNLRNKVSD